MSKILFHSIVSLNVVMLVVSGCSTWGYTGCYDGPPRSLASVAVVFTQESFYDAVACIGLIDTYYLNARLYCGLNLDRDTGRFTRVYSIKRAGLFYTWRDNDDDFEIHIAPGRHSFRVECMYMEKDRPPTKSGHNIGRTTIFGCNPITFNKGLEAGQVYELQFYQTDTSWDASLVELGSLTEVAHKISMDRKAPKHWSELAKCDHQTKCDTIFPKKKSSKKESGIYQVRQ